MNFLTDKQVLWFGWLSWFLMIVAGVAAIVAGFAWIPAPGTQICGVVAAVATYLARAFEQKLQPTGSKIEAPPKAG